MGKSAFGPGIKAGEPNYVLPLMRVNEVSTPRGADTLGDPVAANFLIAIDQVDGIDEAQRGQIKAAVASYGLQMVEEFGCRHDHYALIGQDSIRRYRPVEHMRIRVVPEDSWFEIVARVCAARFAGCRVTVSSCSQNHDDRLDRLHELTEAWAASVEFVEEDDAALVQIIVEGQTDRIRFADDSRVPDVVRTAAAKAGLFLATATVLMEGRVELCWYVHEQSLCVDYHRYGNLGDRSGEQRSPVA